MPFQSRAQARWMFADKPQMAREWAHKTSSIKQLPERAGSQGTQSRRPKGAGGGQFAGYVASPLHRERADA
jgi:hypothetical protein